MPGVLLKCSFRRDAKAWYRRENPPKTDHYHSIGFEIKEEDE
jgi:hypothetical protein